MIITLQDTETREISAKIDELHEERGEAALGRVLTLLISTNEAELEHDLEVANNASREHPCRNLACGARAPGAAARSARKRSIPPSLTPRSASAPTPVRARSSCFVRAAVWSVTPTPW